MLLTYPTVRLAKLFNIYLRKIKVMKTEKQLWAIVKKAKWKLDHDDG
jgi:hypothetical protein